MGLKLTTEAAREESPTDRKTSVTKRSGRPEHEFLSDEQEMALKESWEVVKKKDMQLVGINLLLKLFELEPKTRDTFRAFEGMSQEQILKMPMFKSHAIRFMKAIEVTIENLHALDVIIIPNLKHLGQVHTRIPTFKICYLKVVEQAFGEVWEKILSGEDISVEGIPDTCLFTEPNKKSLSGSSGSLSRSSNSLKIYKNNDNKKKNNQVNTKKKSPTGIEWDGAVKEAWGLTVSLLTSTITEGYHEGMEAKRLKEEKKVQQLEEELAKLKVEQQQKQEDEGIKVEEQNGNEEGYKEGGRSNGDSQNQ